MSPLSGRTVLAAWSVLLQAPTEQCRFHRRNKVIMSEGKNNKNLCRNPQNWLYNIWIICNTSQLRDQYKCCLHLCMVHFYSISGKRGAGCSGRLAAWSLLVFPKCGQRIGTIQIQIQKQGEIQLVSFPNEKGGQRRPHGGLRRIGRWADCRAGPRETIDWWWTIEQGRWSSCNWNTLTLTNTNTKVLRQQIQTEIQNYIPVIQMLCILYFGSWYGIVHSTV